MSIEEFNNHELRYENIPCIIVPRNLWVVKVEIEGG
jgi:hypothetical protein